VQTIAVIGVPWNTHELVPAAEDAADLGLRLSIVDTQDALAKLPPELPCGRLPAASMDPAVIAAAIRAQPLRYVVSLTELRLELAAQVREVLGYPGNPSLAERAVSDKLVTRQTLAAAGLTGVEFWPTTIAELPELVESLRRPVVVKPRALAGSNGVRLVARPADVADVMCEYDPVIAARYGRDRVLVETFIPGTEISAECLTVEGRLVLLSLTDKINTGPPNFQEIGHVMPGRDAASRREQVAEYLQRVVTALGITTAPIHAELKLHDDGVELVEIHTRFGGGSIVRLLTESLSVRPFKAYFDALLSGRVTDTRAPDAVWGVGFFTARVGRPFSWKSFDMPHPGSVVEIDLDTRRQPKRSEMEGIRIRYWRAGQALFSSTRYEEVYENVTFMAAQFPL
jgi:predicted ATP-grasp superfamily ATP-dependent carboligase